MPKPYTMNSTALRRYLNYWHKHPRCHRCGQLIGVDDRVVAIRHNHPRDHHVRKLYHARCFRQLQH